ncbi:MAG TPA: DJ-1/PfpI family protein [Deltaproteobacteria bacterium]|nr:DJ-1/PfpI family protein [Deltaproteobacteria bacterium]
MKRVAVPLAPGFEEVEALTVVDILRRAGAEVVMAGTVDGPIEGRNGIRVLADTSLDAVSGETFDAIFLPGGVAGTKNLREDARVGAMLRRHADAGALVAAICAAPTVLAAAGVIRGRTVTCHPSVAGELRGERLCDERVKVDGTLVTSRGPGTAMEMAFRLTAILLGEARAAEVNRGVLARL